MVIDKDHRYSSDMILRKINKLIYALDEFPGNLKITIEVEDGDI